MKKIILFSRTSTTQQDVEQQSKVLVVEAERLGYSKENQILIEYQESGIKLGVDERIGIQKLKDAIINDTSIDCVVCWELTRIARRADVIYNIRDFLLEHKIRWVVTKPSFMEIINSDGELTQMSSLLLGIFTSFAESEMAIKRDRFVRAKSEMKEHGQKFAGAVLFGYMKDKDKKCIPHPVNSQIIVDIYNHYIDTDSSLHDTYLYISSKYPHIFPVTDYKKAQHKIRHFFEVETYATGNWCYPPLVTVEMRNNVLEKMSKARCKARYNSKREMLCRGKIYCGHCGRMMTGSGGNTKAYCCSTDKQHSLQINWAAADWLIWEETKSIININATIDHNNKIVELNNNIKDKKTLKNQYEIAIEDNKSKMDKLVNLYMKNRIDDEVYNKKYDELKAELDTFSNYIKKINTEISSLENILDNTQRDIMNPKPINVDSINDFETRQEFIRKYISKMIITRDKYFTEQKHIVFEYLRPVVSARSEYLYIAKNQYKRIYRINEDETKDLIYEDAKTYKRDVTGKYTKNDLPN